MTTPFTEVIEAGVTDVEHRNEVALLGNYIMNTSPGWRPSDAARKAVGVYEQGGIAAVRSYDGRDERRHPFYRPLGG